LRLGDRRRWKGLTECFDKGQKHKASDEARVALADCPCFNNNQRPHQDLDYRPQRRCTIQRARTNPLSFDRSK